MRFDWFVALFAGLLLAFALLPRAHAQPRPSDAEPLDFLPPPVTVPAPAVPGIPSVPGIPRAPVDIPPGSALPSNAPVEMPPEISPNADKSRYVWHGGRWWYLQPANRWMYWSEGRWVEFQRSRYGSTPAYVQPPANPRRWKRLPYGTAAGVPPATYRYPAAPGYPAAGY
jgi:hypothetical protein